jgi:hypothetical protein
MKKSGLRKLGWVLSILAFSAPAMAAQDLLCVRSDGTAGAPAYLLVIKQSMPDGTAIILEKNFSAFRSTWQVDYEAASVSHAADGGPMSVTGTLDTARIDWDAPEHARQCFLGYRTMRFNLTENTQGTKGTLTLHPELARNPNMKDCPNPAPAPETTFPVACTEY